MFSYIHTSFPFLDKLFELYLFMQTVIPDENHVEGFILAHTQSPDAINFDIIFALSKYP